MAIFYFTIAVLTKFQRQHGRMVSASENPSLESHSGNFTCHLLDLFSVVKSSKPLPRLEIANWLPPARKVEVFNPDIFYLGYLFLIF